jgi:hypothetical protein
MTKQIMPIVNACDLISDDEVRNFIPGLQLQYDRDFKPAWGDAVPDIEYTFVSKNDIGNIAPSSWPQFLNRHSQEPDALGWHTEEGNRVFGRVFVGDCMAFGISWQTDVGHEALETALDPTGQKVSRMPDGRFMALESCDAVEADKYSYMVLTAAGLRIPCTNFDYPAYFSTLANARYDHCKVLTAPYSLSEGGYADIMSAGVWSTLQKNHSNGVPGRRYLQPYRHRRVLRRSHVDDVIVS